MKYIGKFHYSVEDLRELFGEVVPDCFKEIMEVSDNG